MLLFRYFFIIVFWWKTMYTSLAYSITVYHNTVTLVITYVSYHQILANTTLL